MKFQQLTADDFEILGADLEKEIVNVAIDAAFQDYFLIQKVEDKHFVVAGVMDGPDKYLVLWDVKDYVNALKTSILSPLFQRNVIMIVED